MKKDCKFRLDSVMENAYKYLKSLPMTNSSEENSYNKNNPYSSQLLVNRMLTEGSDKETAILRLSLQDSGLEL